MKGARIIAAVLAAFLIGGPIANATGGGTFIGVIVAIAVYALFPLVISNRTGGSPSSASQKETSGDEN